VGQSVPGLTTDAPRESRAAIRGFEGPTRLERIGLVALFAAAIIFGPLVELRSAFLTHRRTDLDVFLRAAWAARTGRDIYTITDPNGWHFHYPPIFAIAMIPLADPPPGESRAWTLPYAVTVAIWYVLSLVMLAASVHLLASALERAGARAGGIPPPGSRAWWALRAIPVAIAIAPIGNTLSRGQSNFIELLALSAMVAAIVERRSVAAGLWLAGAVCIKVIPLYLLVYPVWRRDFRMLAACGVGLALGLFLLPMSVLGSTQTLGYFSEWNRVLLEPAMGSGADRSRAEELLDINGTDNQSFVAIIHNWINFDETIHVPRGSRSAATEPYLRTMHYAAGALFTMFTLLAAGWRRSRSSTVEELVPAAMIIVMILASPVSHNHYFVLAIPLIMGLMLDGSTDGGYPSMRRCTLLVAFGIATALPLLPGLEWLGDLGLASFAALALWFVAMYEVHAQDKGSDGQSSKDALIA
jgi:alpha-1,2-mannosyltransferase